MLHIFGWPITDVTDDILETDTLGVHELISFQIIVSTKCLHLPGILWS